MTTAPISTTTTAPTSISTTERERGPRVAERQLVPWWLPAVPLLAWVVVLAVRAGDVARTAGLNSDFAAPFVLAGLRDEAPDGALVTLGQYGWYEALWLAEALEGLPGRDTLWQAAPFAVFALTVVLVGWAVRSVAGGRAALLAVTALGAASTSALSFLTALNAHGLVVLHAAFAAAALVLLVRRAASWPDAAVAAWAVVVAVVTAAGGAGEVLVLPAVLLPLTAGGLLAVHQGAPRRVGVAAAGAAVHAGLGALLLSGAMRDAGVVRASFPLRFAEAQELMPRGRALGTSILAFGNGDPFGELVDAWSVLALLAAAVVAAGALWLARRSWTAPSAGWSALAAFWATAVAGVAAAFVLSATASDAPSARYLLAVWAGLCVLASLAARSATERRLVTLAVTALATVSVLELARGQSTRNPLRAPEAADTARLAAFVEREGLDHGYGPYWSAVTTTWQTRLRAKVHPVRECGDRLCPHLLHTISSWYVPRAGIRTFIVLDRGGPGPLPEPSRAVFGRPATVARLGRLEVHVYDYDVASRFPSA